jgi:hypothetical protein
LPVLLKFVWVFREPSQCAHLSELKLHMGSTDPAVHVVCESTVLDAR